MAEPEADFDLDLSGIGIRMTGLTPAIAERLRREWPAFATAAAAPPWLCLSVTFSAVTGAREEPEFRPKAMRAELERDAARFTLPEGCASIGARGPARIELQPERGDRAYFTLLNLLRACLAWRLPDRAGALLHAAGLVVDGRAFVLVGGEGSGKSTWAALGERGGARVLSDDLVVVDGARGIIEALGAPFRSTHRAAYAPGRWPLAAILFPERGAAPSWRPASALLARARLAANLPFIAEALGSDGRVAATIERLATDVPCADLCFGLDPSFVDVLRDWPR